MKSYMYGCMGVCVLTPCFCWKTQSIDVSDKMLPCHSDCHIRSVIFLGCKITPFLLNVKIFSGKFAQICVNSRMSPGFRACLYRIACRIAEESEKGKLGCSRYPWLGRSSVVCFIERPGIDHAFGQLLHQFHRYGIPYQLHPPCP